jgi:hypothetical protein
MFSIRKSSINYPVLPFIHKLHYRSVNAPSRQAESMQKYAMIPLARRPATSLCFFFILQATLTRYPPNPWNESSKQSSDTYSWWWPLHLLQVCHFVLTFKAPTSDIMNFHESGAPSIYMGLLLGINTSQRRMKKGPLQNKAFSMISTIITTFATYLHHKTDLTHHMDLIPSFYQLSSQSSKFSCLHLAQSGKAHPRLSPIIRYCE